MALTSVDPCVAPADNGKRVLALDGAGTAESELAVESEVALGRSVGAGRRDERKATEGGEPGVREMGLGSRSAVASRMPKARAVKRRKRLVSSGERAMVAEAEADGVGSAIEATGSISLLLGDATWAS